MEKNLKKNLHRLPKAKLGDLLFYALSIFCCFLSSSFLPQYFWALNWDSDWARYWEQCLIICSYCVFRIQVVWSYSGIPVSIIVSGPRQILRAIKFQHKEPVLIKIPSWKITFFCFLNRLQVFFSTVALMMILAHFSKTWNKPFAHCQAESVASLGVQGRVCWIAACYTCCDILWKW